MLKAHTFAKNQNFIKTRALVAGAYKTARPTRQPGRQGSQADKAARPTRQPGQENMRAGLNCPIFVAPINRINIQNKTGGTHH